MSKKKKRTSLSREEILLLHDSDLLAYYDASFKAMNELCSLQERAYQIRAIRHKISRNNIWFNVATLVIIIALILFSTNLFLPLESELRGSIVSWLAVALAAVQMFRFAFMRISNLRIRATAIAYRDCVREIDALRSNPPVELKNALTMFEDPRDIEYIQELRRVVFKAIAATHSDAAKEVQRATERMEDLELKRKIVEAINRSTEARSTNFSDRIAKIVGISSGGMTIIDWLTKMFTMGE